MTRIEELKKVADVIANKEVIEDDITRRDCYDTVNIIIEQMERKAELNTIKRNEERQKKLVDYRKYGAEIIKLLNNAEDGFMTPGEIAKAIHKSVSKVTYICNKILIPEGMINRQERGKTVMYSIAK